MDISWYPGTRWLGPQVNQQNVRRALERGLPPNTVWDKRHLVPGARGRRSEHTYWAHFNTPLHHALWHGDLQTADLLLAAGAKIDQLNFRGRTPLHEAVHNKRHSVIQFLLRHGASISKCTSDSPTKYEPLDESRQARSDELGVPIALYLSDETALRLLLTVPVDLYAPRPWTTLDVAVWTGNPLLINVLVEKDPDLLTELHVSATTPRSNSRVSADHAQELLTLADSEELLPPSSLYDVYCKALRLCREYIALPLDAAALVTAFSEHLRVASGAEPSRVCQPCRRAMLKLGVSKNVAVKVHASKQHLDDSAAQTGCHLCCLLADAIDIELSRRTAAAAASSSSSSSSSSSGESPANRQQRKGSSPRPIKLYTNQQVKDLWVSWGHLRIRIPISSYSQTWAERVQELGTVDHATNSVNSLKMATAWLHDCRKHQDHLPCSAWQESQQKIPPTRLLFLGESDKPARIVETAGEAGPTPYVALSYCRGTGTFPTLTRETYDPMRRAVDADSLPVLFREAVAVAQGLGFRYIWIDALCIVQDDADDWAHETAQMSNVYGGADLTISTVAGADPFTGLFSPRKTRIAHPVPLDIWTSRPARQHKTNKGRIPAAVPRWLSENFAWRGPVHTRAWALQEQLMSTRILWFGDGMIFFECLKGYRFEMDPMHDAWFSQGATGKRHMMEHRAKIARVRGAQTPQLRHKGREVTPFRLWQRFVEEYTERGITKVEDRLPALGPLTLRLGRLAGEPVAHGMFVGDMALRALAWRSKVPSRKCDHVPSWMWPSVSGIVTYDLDDSDEREGYHQKPRGAAVVDLATRGDTSLSHVAGRIKLKGRLWLKRPLTRLIVDNALKPSGRLDDWDRGHGLIHLDEPLAQEEAFYAMALMDMRRGLPDPTAPAAKMVATLLLLLRRVPGETSVYRRVGIATIPKSMDQTRSLLHEPALQTLGPESDFRWVIDFTRVYENATITVV